MRYITFEKLGRPDYCEILFCERNIAQNSFLLSTCHWIFKTVCEQHFWASQNSVAECQRIAIGRPQQPAQCCRPCQLGEASCNVSTVWNDAVVLLMCWDDRPFQTTQANEKSCGTCDPEFNEEISLPVEIPHASILQISLWCDVCIILLVVWLIRDYPGTQRLPMKTWAFWERSTSM